jgi:hypothetical protein
MNPLNKIQTNKRVKREAMCFPFFVPEHFFVSRVYLVMNLIAGHRELLQRPYNFTDVAKYD